MLLTVSDAPAASYASNLLGTPNRYLCDLYDLEMALSASFAL